MRRPAPPPRAVAFLRWAIGLSEPTESILGDLSEEFGQRVERDGSAAASRWFWRQSLWIGIVFRFRGRAVRRGARQDSDGGQTRTTLLDWPRAGMSWLDFKLGLRMLARYPALTVVASVAMALGIAIGATVFQVVSEAIFPDHPYAEVDRIVGLQNMNTRSVRVDRRALHDFATWKDQLGSVEFLGARRSGRWTNLDIGDGVPEPVVGVATSATAFALAPVPPLFGRPLLEADEEE